MVRNVHEITSATSIPNKKILQPIALLFILFSFVLLNGCSHVRTKDGPPNFYVDETKIPNAVPKWEKLSRIGNQDHYTVFGKRYYIMRTSRNYEERGVASWYGTKFHSRHTSNGERYNMLGMTAAHKTLPLPTYVQVTNLKNGKQVIVKVNDRGPFESNRLIDLSYVAAKKLGMIGHGTTVVDVKAIDPRDSAPKFNFFARKTSSTPSRINDFLPQKNYAQSPQKPHHAYVPKQYATYASKRHHYKSMRSNNYAQAGKIENSKHTVKVKRQVAYNQKRINKTRSLSKSTRNIRPFNEASAKRSTTRLPPTEQDHVTESFDITDKL